MQELEFVKATDLDEAWSNFDPLLPLPSGCPFYVERPGRPLEQLTSALLRRYVSPPKYFFTGYRGSGKSTELNRLADDPGIKQNYFVVKFSVKDVCDVNNLNYVDVLLAIGAQVFVQYTERGGRLDEDLLAELEGWKGRVVERLQEKGAVFETGAGFDVRAFFLSALAKVKTEHSTREIIREEIEPRLSELIEKVNLIATAIQAREGRPVLVIIDDLDKPPLDQAKAIFYDAFTAITQPICAIVYTVPVAILFSEAFMSIRESCFPLPNVKLHERGKREEKVAEGYETMRDFVLQRMEEPLIEPDALEAAITLSGGVFREMAFVMRTAISNALRRGADKVGMPDIAWAESQLRNPLLRLLSDKDFAVLKEVRKTNPFRLPEPEKNARLLHILAVLQYANGPDWFDVHPALEAIWREE